MTATSSLFQAGPNERIMVCVRTFILPYTFYQVNSLNNSFIVQDCTSGTQTTVSIPYGNYNAITLVTALKTALPGWTVAYQSSTSTFNFRVPVGSGLHQFIFSVASILRGLGEVIGFLYTDTAPFISITAPHPINVSPITRLYLSTTLPVAKTTASVINFENYDLSTDTVTAGGYRNSNVLFELALTVAPGCLQYRCIERTDAWLILSDNTINQVRFSISDEFGSIIPLVTDYSFALAIGYVPVVVNTTERLLGEVLRYLNRFYVLFGGTRGV
jgi:hypothetical protein